MAGFFRKVAGAFIEVERSEKARAEGASAPPGDPNLEEITRGASELLAQLETTQSQEGSRRRDAQPAGDIAAAPPGQVSGSRMGLTAEQVFAQSGMDEGPHTAPRMLRMIAGLSMFPAEQQVVMVRAMDQADDTWSEEQVLDDARRRQSVLRSHLQALEEERAARIQELDALIQSTQGQGKQLVEELDRRIGELQIQREAAISDATAAVNQLEQQKKAVEGDSENARRGITHVINALSGLMGFFGQRTAP
jgi:hypothetical protein